MDDNILNILPKDGSEMVFKRSENQGGMIDTIDDNAVNGPDDCVRMQSLTGNNYVFYVKDSCQLRSQHGKKKPALPFDQCAFMSLKDGKVYWRHCAPWMDEKKNLVKKTDSSLSDYKLAPWVTSEDVTSLDWAKLQINNGYIIAVIVDYS
jgi:hypothetical protein